MDDDDNDDDLRDLLTYDCPLTGRKRTAGEYPDLQNKTPQCLGVIGLFSTLPRLKIGKKKLFKETQL